MQKTKTKLWCVGLGGTPENPAQILKIAAINNITAMQKIRENPKYNKLNIVYCRSFK